MEIVSGEGVKTLKDHINLRQPVLIVEDEIYIAAEIERLLRGHGFIAVETCSTFDEARRQMALRTFGLLVIDINLKGQLSFPIIEDAVTRGLPVVATSGYVSDADDLEQTAFLPKPIRPGALSAAIIQASQKAQSRSVLEV